MFFKLKFFSSHFTFTMESLKKFFSTVIELNVQLVCLKYAGFIQSPSKVQKVFAFAYKIAAFMTTFYVIVTESTYVIRNVSNIVAITESVAAVVAKTLTLMIMPTLWYHIERIFKMINEFKELAEKC